MATFSANAFAKCPHCQTTVKFPGASVEDVKSYHGQEEMRITAARCPQCQKVAVTIEIGQFKVTDATASRKKFEPESEYVVWPQQYTRPVPSEVPLHIADDYNEAAAVLNISPKASAALSRRCLQAVLRDAAKAEQKNLYEQIKAVTPTLPSYIAENVDAIRQIGNFAAHPIKEQASDQIVEVEPGEAEWNLDVLDLLFDFYYVQPEIAKRKRAKLNSKLKAAGKKPAV